MTLKQMMRVVDRTAGIVGSYTRTRHPPERADRMAHARLVAEEVHQRMVDFIDHIYTKEAGYYLYILPSGQIPAGVWVPWGSSGKSKLPRRYRDILRTWVVAQRKSRSDKAPFYFLDEYNRWFVDLALYECKDQAFAWWTRNRISDNEWLAMYMSALRRVKE